MARGSRRSVLTLLAAALSVVFVATACLGPVRYQRVVTWRKGHRVVRYVPVAVVPPRVVPRPTTTVPPAAARPAPVPGRCAPSYAEWAAVYDRPWSTPPGLLPITMPPHTDEFRRYLQAQYLDYAKDLDCSKRALELADYSVRPVLQGGLLPLSGGTWS
jgi:hypothetical protein